MSEHIDHKRRRFLGTAATSIAAASLGVIRSARAQSGKTQQAAVSPPKPGSHTASGPIKQIDAGLLNVGYADVGRADGPVVILLHGWPYDIHSYVDVASALASAGYRAIVPYLRGYGTTRFLSSETFRNAQQSAVALDIIALMDALQIKKAIVAGFDWGSRTAAILAAVWPERCKALVAVSGYLITNRKANLQPLPPAAELGWWYQYYFSTERGALGYTKYRHDFNKLIWKQASPKWDFDDATFDRTATSRLSLEKGDPRYDALEEKLSQAPVITVPAITIASDFDGAAADGKSYAKKFSGKYSHRILDGIGHNVPQEAPDAFAKAVVEVDGYTA